MLQIPDPDLSTPDPGSRGKKAPDPDPQRIKVFPVFNPKNCCQNLGNMIQNGYLGSPDLGSPDLRFRIHGSEKHWIPKTNTTTTRLPYVKSFYKNNNNSAEYPKS